MYLGEETKRKETLRSLLLILLKNNLSIFSRKVRIEAIQDRILIGKSKKILILGTSQVICLAKKTLTKIAIEVHKNKIIPLHKLNLLDNKIIKIKPERVQEKYKEKNSRVQKKNKEIIYTKFNKINHENLQKSQIKTNFSMKYNNKSK